VEGRVDWAMEQPPSSFNDRDRRVAPRGHSANVATRGATYEDELPRRADLERRREGRTIPDYDRNIVDNLNDLRTTYPIPELGYGYYTSTASKMSSHFERQVAIPRLGGSMQGALASHLAVSWKP
jgi:hypothetical protein